MTLIGCFPLTPTMIADVRRLGIVLMRGNLRTAVITTRGIAALRGRGPWGTWPSVATVTRLGTVGGSASKELGRPVEFQIIPFLLYSNHIHVRLEWFVKLVINGT